MTAFAQYPRRERPSKRSRVTLDDTPVEPVKKKVFAGDPHAQKAQQELENLAELVSQADEHYTNELGSNAETIMYMKMALARIQPILQYSFYHTDHEFENGYGPTGSSLDRARVAALYLFISANTWTNRALAASVSRPEDLDKDIVAVIMMFRKAMSTIESYLEENPSVDVTWAMVGTRILFICRQAWPSMMGYVERVTPTTKSDDNLQEHDGTLKAAGETSSPEDGTINAADEMPNPTEGKSKAANVTAEADANAESKGPK